MNKQVDVYVNGQGQPQHLAVLNEHKHHLQVGAEAQYRSICGADTTGMEVKQMPANDAKVGCTDCKEQLKMWKEIHAE